MLKRQLEGGGEATVAKFMGRRVLFEPFIGAAWFISARRSLTWITGGQLNAKKCDLLPRKLTSIQLSSVLFLTGFLAAFFTCSFIYFIWSNEEGGIQWLFRPDSWAFVEILMDSLWFSASVNDSCKCNLSSTNQLLKDEHFRRTLPASGDQWAPYKRYRSKSGYVISLLRQA